MNPALLEKLLRGLRLDGLVLRGSNWMANCPFHSESNPSWGISIHPPHMHACFSCSAKGTLYTLLVGRFKFSESDAKSLTGDSNLTLKNYGRDLLFAPEETEDQPIDETELYPYVLTPRAIRFLKSRHVSPFTANKLDLVDNTNDDRLMFPWYYEGDLVGATGRTLINDRAKTLPYYKTKKGRWLYLPSQKISAGPFVLCEGELDAIRIYQIGHINVGATCFGKITKRQAQLIINSAADPVILFFDDDKVGSEISAEAFKLMHKYKLVQRVNYEQFRPHYVNKLDPGEMTDKDLRKALTDKGLYSSNWPMF